MVPDSGSHEVYFQRTVVTYGLTQRGVMVVGEIHGYGLAAQRQEPGVVHELAVGRAAVADLAHHIAGAHGAGQCQQRVDGRREPSTLQNLAQSVGIERLGDYDYQVLARVAGKERIGQRCSRHAAVGVQECRDLGALPVVERGMTALHNGAHLMPQI